jgi:hypothetical protein
MVFRCESTSAVASIALCSSAIASLLEQPGEAHMGVCTGWVQCNVTVQQLKLCWDAD